MNWSDTSHLEAAAACLLLCGVLGWFVPRLIARVPEPQPEPQPEPESEPESEPQPEPQPQPESSRETAPVEVPGAGRRLFDTTLPPAAPKESYADIAAVRGLGPASAAVCALVGALLGAAVGWTGALLYLVPLVPIGAALFVIDWRTTLLPTWILHRTYVLMAVLVPLAALVDNDLHSLYLAGWGWLVLGGWFWGFWFLTRGGGWGFGDVRLSRVLGPALGYLGWHELLMGLLLITVVGGLGAIGTALAHRTLRRRVPYGPYMLIGALLGVVVGPSLATGLGY